MQAKGGNALRFFADSGPKRIGVTMLCDIDCDALGKAFTRAFEENVPQGETTKPIAGLVRTKQVFEDQKKPLTRKTFTQ